MSTANVQPLLDHAALRSAQHMPSTSPRRRPQELSVSLKHNSSPSRLAAQDASAPPPAQPAELKTLRSQESDGSSNNAEKWFTQSNECVKGKVSFDDDPPFYLEGKSPLHDQLSACALPSNSPPQIGDVAFYSLPVRSAASRIDNLEDDSDEYRSVIDDLTIENKKLKQRLRQYEKSHAMHLEDEMLFEVKIGRLPPHKKKALEQLLWSFSEGLDSPIDAATAMPKPPVQAKLTQTNLASARNARNAPSSSTSGSRPVDSAYASMSTSGANSALPSGLGAPEERKAAPSEHQAHKSSSVQDYLREIPEGLLPRHSLVMTEKSKKKLVVKRLEQLFVGKDSDKAEHSHPIQQQEVSQSAAQADRTAKIAKGQPVWNEGSREAHIFHPSHPSFDPDGQMPYTMGAQSHLPVVPSNQHSIDESMTSRKSPDQRPTRPLDLDPHRAQYPAENIEYIRHLGLASPKLSPTSSDASDEGWVYLNLLTNMAQLHTINVTPEFVRKALAEVSSKFELSHDGRKIRWRGGREGTRLSSDSGSSGGGAAGRSPAEEAAANGYERPSKRRKTTQQSSNTLPSIPVDTSSDQPHLTNATSSAQYQPPKLKTDKSSSYHYQPLFFHGSTAEDGDDSYDLGSDSPMSSALPERNSSRSAANLTGSGGRRHSSSTKRKHDSSLIFYRKSSFCTDLTGDPGAVHLAATIESSIPAIGAKHHNDDNTDDGPSKILRTPFLPVEMELDNGDPSDDPPALTFPSVSNTKAPPYVAPVYSFEASGLGGVQPADNFALYVSNSHPSEPSPPPTQATPSKSRRAAHHHAHPPKFHHRIPSSALAAFRSSSPNPLTYTNLHTHHCALEPSALPPPSYAFGDSSGSDCDSDTDSLANVDLSGGHPNGGGSVITTSTSNPRPSGAPVSLPDSMGPPHRPASSRLRHQYMFPRSSTTNTSASSVAPTSTTDDGSEIDLLAAARALDPETIAEREREFDRGVGKRFAEELPAGSSAATAGGGSGWDSSEDRSEMVMERIREGEDESVQQGVNAWGQRMGRAMNLDE